MGDLRIARKLEQALAAYLHDASSGTELEWHQILAQVSDDDDISGSCVIVSATSAMELAPRAGVYECELEFSVMTQMDVPGRVGHGEALSALSDLLADDSEINEVLNPPTAGPDNRAVRDFRISILTLIDSGDVELADRRAVTSAKYYVACQGMD